MLKEQNRLIHKTAIFLDAAIVAISFQAAFIMRDYLDIGFLHPLPSFAEYLPVLFLVIPCWIYPAPGLQRLRIDA